jgi:hypothetical protein
MAKSDRHVPPLNGLNFSLNVQGPLASLDVDRDALTRTRWDGNSCRTTSIHYYLRVPPIYTISRAHCVMRMCVMLRSSEAAIKARGLLHSSTHHSIVYYYHVRIRTASLEAIRCVTINFIHLFLSVETRNVRLPCTTQTSQPRQKSIPDKLSRRFKDLAPSGVTPLPNPLVGVLATKRRAVSLVDTRLH